MNCQKCGHELPAGSLFCPNCGAKAAPEPATPVCQTCHQTLKPGALFCANCGTPVNKPAPQPQTPQTYQAPVYAPPPQPVYQQPYQPAWQPAWQPAPPAPPKRKRKGLMITLIVVLVLVLAGGAVYALAGKTIKRMILGPKAMYLSIESKQLKDDASDLVEDLVRIGNISENDIHGGSRINLGVSMPGLSDEMAMDPVLIEALENLSLTVTSMYDRSESDPRYFTSVDLLTQEERLLTLDMYLENDRMVLGLPDILTSYVLVEGSTLSDLMTSFDSPVALDDPFSLVNDMLETDLDIDEAALEKSMHRLIDIVMEHIDEAAFDSKQTVKAGELSVAYDSYTITLSSENMRLMMLELLETIRDDDEIYNLIDQIARKMSSVSSGMSGLDTYGISPEDWEEELNSAIEELEEEVDPEDEFSLLYTVYVDSKDEIRGRDLVVFDDKDNETGHLQLLNPVDGEQEALLIAFEDEYDNFLLVADYEEVDEKRTGSATLDVGGETVATATFSDLDAVVVDEQDYLVGELEVTVEDETAGIPGPIYYSGTMTGGAFSGEIGVRDYLSVYLGYEKLGSADADIPPYSEGDLVDVSNEEALAALFNEDAMNELYEIMSKIGLNME